MSRLPLLTLFWLFLWGMMTGCAGESGGGENTAPTNPPRPTPTSDTSNTTTDVISASDIITIHYHERIPYMFSTASGVGGLTAGPATIAFTEANIPFQWQLTPSNRQLEIAQENSGLDCMLGWFKNPDREQFAKFTNPLYQDRAMVALARSDNDKLHSGEPLADTLSNSDIALLVKEGYSYGPFLDEQIRTLAQNKSETTVENVNMVQMIERRRADYFFIAPEEVEPLLAQAQLNPDDFSLVDFKDMPPGNKRYLMCSQQVPDEIITRLNEAIAQHVPNAPAP
jgi:polar amino acid transport system substrate-binding protein